MPSRARARIAALAGVVAVLLVAGPTTGARWAASRTIAGTDIHTGRLDLTVDGQQALSGYAALDLSDLVPGGSAAGILTVGNAGTVPLEYAVSLDGTDADGKGLAAALATTVTDADTTGGATCGGTALAASTTLAAGATDRICVEVRLPGSAPASLAGALTHLTIMLSGDVNDGWTDAVPVTGSTVATAAPTPPTLSCGALGLASATLGWNAVPGATGYRVESGALLGGGALDVPADTLSTTFTGVAGTATVRAIFGTTAWLSPPSNTRTFSAVSGVGTCA